MNSQQRESAMGTLEKVHQTFIVKETVITIVVNVTLTGIITYLMFHDHGEIGLWGKNGIFFDLIPTIVIMTFLMTVVMTPVTRTRIKKGTAPAAPWQGTEHYVFRFFSVPFFLRGLLFGLLALLILLPSTTGLLLVFNKFSMTVLQLIVFKTFLAVFISLIFAPAILVLAMSDA
jgi:hypothetical protein